MVDIFYLCFEFAPAIRMIFNLSYIPQKEDFKELTSLQYDAFRRKANDEDAKSLLNKKILAFLPDDPIVYSRLVNTYGDDLVIVGEDEIGRFADAEYNIDLLCNKSGKKFKKLRDKLIYMAQTLPEEFSEDTPYAIHAKLSRRFTNII